MFFIINEDKNIYFNKGSNTAFPPYLSSSYVA